MVKMARLPKATTTRTETELKCKMGMETKAKMASTTVTAKRETTETRVSMMINSRTTTVRRKVKSSQIMAKRDNQTMGTKKGMIPTETKLQR